jgi:hypothetical protein
MLCFLLLFLFDRSTAQENFKIFYPEYILTNANFQVSIITSKKFPDAENIILYFLPDFSLTISKIELWTMDEKIQLTPHPEYIDELSKEYQKINIDLSDTTLFENDRYFQIVLFLKSGRATINNMKFFGEFRNKETLIAKLASSNENIISDEPDQYQIKLSYFEKSLTPEFAASLTRDAYLNIPLVYNFDGILALEFWMKTKNVHSTFLQIINWETNWIEYSVSINENQMLEFNFKDNLSQQINPYFLSQNIWYHIQFNFNKFTSELSLLINGSDVARIKIRNYLALDNLVLHFMNEQLNGEINLEQFRIIELNNSVSGVVRNQNYSEYSDDSSRVIFQLNFNDIELDKYIHEKNLSYEKINLVKSDAPIFPKAPKINIKLLNNFYEIEWNGGSYQNADYYVLEKAIDSNDFVDVGKKEANNDEEKEYSMLSEKNDQTEIVFFRIRQVNYDGSIVYSEVVKVGQGLIEDVIIGQNYPNPFNPSTVIEFDLLQDSDVEVIVYNLSGKEISVIHRGFLASGSHQLKFNATGLPSGIYLYQIKTLLSSQTRKMILAK